MSLLDVTDRVGSRCVKCNKPLNKEDAKSKQAGTRPCRRCRKKERQASFDTCPADEKKVNDWGRVALMSAFIADMRADIIAEAKAGGELGAVQRVIDRRLAEGKSTTVTDLMARRTVVFPTYEPPMEDETGQAADNKAFTSADLNWHKARVEEQKRRSASGKGVMSC